MVHDLFLLETDPDIFLKKTLEDIEFIDDALGILLEDLVENNNLIERNELFDNLSELERQFSDVLTLFLTSSGNISALHFPAFREKIIFIRSHSLSRKTNIDDLRQKSAGVILEPVVSSTELSELLKGL